MTVVNTEIDYFFQFASEAAARADPDVGPFFSTGNLRSNIWPFDLSIYPSMTQYTGYWCMVGQFSPNADLQSNANCKFLLTVSGDILFQSYRLDGTNNFITTAVDSGKALYAANWALGSNSLLPPTVSNVSPGSGSTLGGTPIIVTGINFFDVLSVKVGGNPATGVVVDNANTLHCTTPAGNAGTVDVTVTTPAGTGTGHNLYTYSVSGESFQTLLVGAGGYVTGIGIANDGTAVARADTYGSYVRGPLASSWTQLLTLNSMPNDILNVPLAFDGCYEVAIAPSNSTRIYMTYRNQVYVSSNGGITFAASSFTAKTMEATASDTRMFGPKMAVDPVNPDVCYITTDSQGTYVTFNAGVSWAQVSGIPSNSGLLLGVVCFDRFSGTTGGRTKTIYVTVGGTGVYRSTDAGASFSALSGSGHPVNVLSMGIPTDSGIVTPLAYFGDNAGAIYSLSGTTWASITPAGGESTPAGTLCDPNNAAHIVIVWASGYLQDSTNRGASWGTEGFIHSRVATDVPYLAQIPPVNSSFFFGPGGTFYHPTKPEIWMSGGQGIWKTTSTVAQFPANQEWSSVSAGMEQLVASDIRTPPNRAPVLFSFDSGVLRSTNPNSYVFDFNWDTSREINRAYGGDYAVSNPDFICAVVNQFSESSGFSIDAGITWQTFATFPPFFANGTIGGNIAVSSSNTNVMVWSPQNNGDPYATIDGGATWTMLDFSAFSVPTSPSETGWGFAQFLHSNCVTSDKVTANTFYLYNYGPDNVCQGIYKAVYTSSWTITRPFNQRLSSIGGTGDNQFSIKLKAVPDNAGNLFFTGGVQGSPGDAPGNWPHNQAFWRSTNNGVTWTQVSNVLEVWDFGFGKPIASGYPTVYIYGWVNGSPGIFASTDNCVSWLTLFSGLYPLGWADEVVCVAGQMDTYGTVLLGTEGSGYWRGFLNGQTPPASFVTGTTATGPGIVNGSGLITDPGTTIRINVTYSQEITVVGTPELTLNVAGRSATYAAMEDPVTLGFDYVVQSGDATSKLAVSAVAFPGGSSITSWGGAPANNAAITATLPGTLVIDTTTPTVQFSITDEPAPDFSSATSITFTGVNVGAAASDRVTLIAVSCGCVTGTTVTCTVNGVSAHGVNNTAGISNSGCVALFDVANPTGTTATVVISGGFIQQALITVCRVTGSSSSAPSGSAGQPPSFNANPQTAGPVTIADFGKAVVVEGTAVGNDLSSPAWNASTDSFRSVTNGVFPSPLNLAVGHTGSPGSYTLSMSNSDYASAGVGCLVAAWDPA